jgi:hypothetical protein
VPRARLTLPAVVGRRLSEGLGRIQGLPLSGRACKAQLLLLAAHKRFPLRADDCGRTALEAAAEHALDVVEPALRCEVTLIRSFAALVAMPRRVYAPENRRSIFKQLVEPVANGA